MGQLTQATAFGVSLVLINTLGQFTYDVLPEGDPASDPTPWAQPGPYLTAAGFDGFDVVRQESFGAQQRIAVTYFFYWFDADYFRATRGRTDVDSSKANGPQASQPDGSAMAPDNFSDLLASFGSMQAMSDTLAADPADA